MRISCGLLTLLFTASLASGGSPGFRIAQGFEVIEFARSDLANDITCLTVNAKGEIVVSGRGYIRRLFDTNRDGIADRAEPIIAIRGAAHGLLFEGDDLFYVADGGLHRLRWGGRNRPELIWKLKTGGEHDAHAIRRGPDGWLYLLCGNSTGIDAKFINSSRSPITKPVAGVVVRFSPDLSQREIVADGFRNPYGFAFSPAGDLFTYDSDNERCVSLPWYEQTRCYHVIPGGHYGWLNPQHAAFWRLPPYFADVIEPVCTLERGSPTGVEWWSHPRTPEKFHGLYLLDWTFGRIWLVRPEPAGASFRARPIRFLEAVGGNGFAPTALAVHPKTGDMFVSIGGRGTRGGVYRIRWTGKAPPAAAVQASAHRRDLAWRPEYHAEIMRNVRSSSPSVAWKALADLQRHRERFSTDEIASAVRANWRREDRLCRQVAANLAATLDTKVREVLRRSAKTTREKLVVAAGMVAASADGAVSYSIEIVDQALATAANAKSEPAAALEPIRLFQMAAGDIVDRKHIGHVWEGYSPRQSVSSEARRAIHAIAKRIFPTGHSDIDREVARTLAMIASDDEFIRARISGQWTEHSEPTEDLHYLIVYSRLKGERSRSQTAATAEALLQMDAKLTSRHRNRDSNWPIRMRELHAELAKKDPRLNATMLAHPEFGAPGHAVFTRCPGFNRQAAARRFVQRSRKAGFEWTPESARLIGDLPDSEALPIARSIIGLGFDDALLPVLARSPTNADTSTFLKALTSPSLSVVGTAIEALIHLKPKKEPATVMALMRGLLQLPTGKQADLLRARLAVLLEQTTGQKFGAGSGAWMKWMEREHPDVARQLRSIDGVDIDRWKQKLANIDWSAGSADRGKTVFVRSNCAACHSGGQAVGPDLAGASKRFSRDDLFTAILQPNRDISERYRMTQIETTDGRTILGLIVYDAVDGVILQTPAAETLRVEGRTIDSKKTMAISLMPAGLLDKMNDRELADLYAYLQELNTP